MKNYYLNRNFKILFDSFSLKSVWTGYYDKSPINETDEFILLHQSIFEGRSFQENDNVVVLCINLKNNNIVFKANTKACNWQQGSQLQWIGKYTFIYNDFDGEQYISIIYDIINNNSTKVDFPIYSILYNNDKTLTTNFERLYWTRSYHYYNKKNEKLNGLITPEDSIYLKDLKNGNSKKIIDVITILEKKLSIRFLNYKHWFEHIQVSPNNNYFGVFHRFTNINNNGYFTRFLVITLNGDIIYETNDWEVNNYSHFNWLNDSKIIIFQYKNTKLMKRYSNVLNNKKSSSFILRFLVKFTKKFLKIFSLSCLVRTQGYITIDVDSKKVHQINNKFSTMDGHPSPWINDFVFLSDTYQDKNNFRHLYFYNIKNSRYLWIGKFKSTFNNVDYRADLHPKFNFLKNKIIFDTSHNGYHQCFVLSIDIEYIKRKLKIN